MLPVVADIAIVDALSVRRSYLSRPSAPPRVADQERGGRRSLAAWLASLPATDTPNAIREKKRTVELSAQLTAPEIPCCGGGVGVRATFQGNHDGRQITIGACCDGGRCLMLARSFKGWAGLLCTRWREGNAAQNVFGTAVYAVWELILRSRLARQLLIPTTLTALPRPACSPQPSHRHTTTAMLFCCPESRTYRSSTDRPPLYIPPTPPDATAT
jgi:hypothetical protein